MAFQDFDYISERRKNEKKQKVKRNITIAVVSIVVLVGVIGGSIGAFVVYQKHHGKTNSKSSNSDAKPAAKKEISQSQKAIKTICASTDYKRTCEGALTKAVGPKSTANPQPTELLKDSISAASAELAKAIDKAAALPFNTPEEKGAFEDCKVLLADATEELKSTISDLDIEKSATKLSTIAPDLSNWLSAVMSYQETCFDGFPEGKLKTSLKDVFKDTKMLTSNGLAIIKQLSTLLSKIELPAKSTPARHLLNSDGLPNWISDEDRRLLKEEPKKLTPNVTVAKDGSGNFTTINDALAKLPEKYDGRYVIYIKEGVYEEYVTVTKKMVNITMYGEGSQKTIVTGNKNYVDGVRTFQTATFAALGEGFMAQSMGFRNTAGPEKHQAVALRVQSDRSIFLNCRMEGYQDTLYAQTHRQFYRSCLITGTVDFIFGDAAAVLQNCNLLVRKPLEHQQNIITAQGRVYKHETTGIVLQNCRIQPDETLEPVRTQFKSYLGRPWKEYSRTVVMESDIEDFIHPDGWMEWNGKFALNTLYYAEFNNKGPGAGTANRVKWQGRKVINKEEAEKFTVGPFLEGDSWLKGLDIPVHFGLF